MCGIGNATQAINRVGNNLLGLKIECIKMRKKTNLFKIKKLLYKPSKFVRGTFLSSFNSQTSLGLNLGYCNCLITLD